MAVAEKLPTRILAVAGALALVLVLSAGLVAASGRAPAAAIWKYDLGQPVVPDFSGGATLNPAERPEWRGVVRSGVALFSYDDHSHLGRASARPDAYRLAPRSVTGVADDAARGAWPPNRGFDPISSEIPGRTRGRRR